jgi:hypothetical protein
MIFLGCKFGYIIFLSYVYGMALSDLLSRAILRKRLETSSFSLVSITGLIALNCIATYLSLALPMGGVANIGVLLAGVCLLWGYRRTIRSHWAQYSQHFHTVPLPVKCFFSLSVVFVLYCSSLQSLTYDEGLYYAQFIRWTQAYPIVPGLANLHDRLGFDSSWHVLAALFDGALLTGHNQINGALYLLVLLYLLGSLTQPSRKLSRVLKLLLLVLLCMPQVGVYNLIAPAADLVVFYLLCLILLLWLEHLETGVRLLDSQDALLTWIVPAYLVTIKLSAVPVLLLTMLLCLQALRLRRYRTLGWLVFLQAFLVAGWLIRNVVLTGYLLYPFEGLDLFSYDWKVPAAKVRATREAIEAFGYLRNKASAVQVHTRPDRLRFLFRYNTRPYDLLLILIAPLSPLIVWLRRRELPPRALTLLAFLWVGLAFWFIQAPDPRFGYGYLVSLAALILALLFVRIPIIQTRRMALVCLLAALAFQGGTLVLYRHLKKNLLAEGTIIESPRASLVWMPAPYEEPELDSLDSPFRYYVPRRLDLCWGSPLPCADQTRPDVRRRGPSLGDGFRPGP